MQGDSRNSTFARVGRSYPRPSAADASAAPRSNARRGYRITGALLVVLSALGVLGWLLAR